MDKAAKRYFVIGTDTNVGKTVLSLILMQYFYKNGKTPFYLKPFQTGCNDPCDTDSDAKFIYQHVAQLKDKDPADSVIYCFKNPKAPYFAARDEQKIDEIDLDRIRDVVDQKSEIFDPVIIEAAGGLLLPVNESTLMIDFPKMVEAKPIIAARAGLGTINHTLLTIEALKSRDIEPAGVIMMDWSETPTSPEMINENMEAIETQSLIKVGGVIKNIENFDVIDPLNLMIVENVLMK